MEQDPRADKTQVRKSSRKPSSAQEIPARYDASIVIVEGYGEGMEYPILKTYTVMGRDRDADIPLRDDMVSRRHAAIEFQNGDFLLKDLESTNGTSLNGKLIQQARLRNKDRFQIGDTTIQFIVEDTGQGRVFEIG